MLLRTSAFLVLFSTLAAAPAAAQDHRAVEEGVRERSRALGPERAEKVLEGLEHGIVALRTLGRRDGVEHLEEIADMVRAGMRDARRDRSEGNARERGRDAERQAGMRELRILRKAREVYDEAGWETAAGVLERAIHAREVRLEGLPGIGARAILERDPEPGDLAEVMRQAAELMERRGLREWPQGALQQAEIYQAKAERSAGQRRAREHEEKERGGNAELAERIRRLEDRLAELEDELSALQRRR